MAEHPVSGYGPADFALKAASRVVDDALRKSHIGRVMSPSADATPYQPADGAAFTDEVKSAARFLGASDVGVARADQRWLYPTGDDKEPPVLAHSLTTVVVMTIEMDYALVATSPAATAAAATGLAYSQMASAAVSVAGYLAALGYSALPCGNDVALSIPLAVDAGLGELARSGNLITQRHGPRVRLCKVFTDAPLAADAPIDLGVRATCEGCTICADACPGGAIDRRSLADEGPDVRWQTDAEKCRAFWRVNGTNCANCIARCPYNHPPALLRRQPRPHVYREGIIAKCSPDAIISVA